MKLRAASLCAAAALAGACLVGVTRLAAQTPEASKTLLPGPGADLTMAKCAICHDITHVTRTRLSRAEWEDNIRVMIARGMPAQPEEDRLIVEYLSTYYNRDAPPPAASTVVADSAGERPIERAIADLGCSACHALEKRVIGPSFREIADRYKGDPGAAARLVLKVKEGGAGAWGQIPMPPHPQASDDEVKRLVAWVLAQR